MKKIILTLLVWLGIHFVLVVVQVTAGHFDHFPFVFPNFLLKVSLKQPAVLATKPEAKSLNVLNFRAKLRVESGLFSVRLIKPIKRKKRGSDQVNTPLKIALFSNDKLLRMRECGDRQCILKLSEAESLQVVSQQLHTNLPQPTLRADDQQSHLEQAMVGPLPSLKVALLNDIAVTQLAVEAQGQGELLGLEHVVWLNQIEFEVSKNILHIDEVSVVREPAFIPSTFVDLIDSLECNGAKCLLTREGIELFSVDPKRTRLRVKMNLKRAVSVNDGQRPRSSISQAITLKRCSIMTPNLPLLGGIKQHKLLLAIARGCGAGKYRSIEVKTWPPTRSHIQQEFPFDDPSWRFFELLIEETPTQGEFLEVALVKKKRDELLLGEVQVSLKQSYQPQQLRLNLKDLGPIDFIPTNQDATLMLAYEDPAWLKLLKPKPYLGFYLLEQKQHKKEAFKKAKTQVDLATPKSTHVLDQDQKDISVNLFREQVERTQYSIRAEEGASGYVPLLMSYQPQFETIFSRFNHSLIELATFKTETRYTLRNVNTPIRLTEGLEEQAPVSVSCANLNQRIEITPRKVFLIPYESRHSCRVTIKKERIPKSAGRQHILVTEDREKFKRVVTVSHGIGEIVIGIPIKKSKEFDHLEIGVGHNYSSAQYDFAPQQDLGAESRYEVVLGDRSFGVSLSTSLPTGLFRYGFSEADRSSVALSAGGLGRLLWLWKEGRPFPVGIDFGMLVTGIDGEPHLSMIGGLGVSVPVLNANTPFEASFNLHAWLEYAPTRAGVGHSPWSLLFGPSFAVGKFSTNL